MRRLRGFRAPEVSAWEVMASGGAAPGESTAGQGPGRGLQDSLRRRGRGKTPHKTNKPNKRKNNNTRLAGRRRRRSRIPDTVCAAFARPRPGRERRRTASVRPSPLLLPSRFPDGPKAAGPAAPRERKSQPAPVPLADDSPPPARPARLRFPSSLFPPLRDQRRAQPTAERRDGGTPRAQPAPPPCPAGRRAARGLRAAVQRSQPEPRMSRRQ